MTDYDRYLEARKRVNQKKSFYRHFASYIAVNIALLIVSEGESFPVILFWGIGIVSHYLKVFGFPGRSRVLSREWEEREIEKELRKMGPPEQHEEVMIPEDELELKEFKKLRKEWDDSEFV